MKDPDSRQQPYNYHERFETVLKPEKHILQQELLEFHTWTIRNKLLANTKKCLTMQFSQAKKCVLPMEFTMGGTDILEEQKTLRLLGLLVQSNLKWDSQIMQMISRANKTIWVLRRMKALGIDITTLVEYWRVKDASI